MMDKNLKNLIEAINSDKERGVSNARSVKRHLVELEAVLDSGIPLKKFVEDLKESGFKCTYRTIQNILYLYRKNKKLNTVQSPLNSNTQKDEITETPILKNGNTQVDTTTPQKIQREKPKTLAQIRAETDAFFKAAKNKPSAAVQKRIDRLNKENSERKERENVTAKD